MQSNFNLFLLLLALTGCGHTVVDKEIQQKESEPLLCTRDINEWGYSSKCKCHGQNEIYDQKKGKCFAK